MIRLLAKMKNLKRKLLLSPFPGHYDSPIVDTEDIRQRENEIFSFSSKEVPGIELNEECQLELFRQFETYYRDIPFKKAKNTGRYFYENGFYLYSDAIFLYSVMRHFHPKRIIEIGAGFSSAAMLDAADSLGFQDMRFTFIEPYPDRIKSLLRKEDYRRCDVIEKNIQNVDTGIYDELSENDILFVDSSHVSKTGSDVNKILFEILPKISKGVLIHFHDIFFPFEYPKPWVLDWNAFGWNENYILRAFLMYNRNFEIVFFNTFLEHFYKERFSATMPDCLKQPGGSIWIRKK